MLVMVLKGFMRKMRQEVNLSFIIYHLSFVHSIEIIE